MEHFEEQIPYSEYLSKERENMKRLKEAFMGSGRGEPMEAVWVQDLDGNWALVKAPTWKL